MEDWKRMWAISALEFQLFVVETEIRFRQYVSEMQPKQFKDYVAIIHRSKFPQLTKESLVVFRKSRGEV